MISGTDDRLKEMKEMYDRQVKAVWGLDDLARDGRKLIELACEGHEDWAKQQLMDAWESVEKDIESMQGVIRDRAYDIEIELNGKVSL